MSRILIVDDDISTREVLAEQLSAPDREIATAADGVEALATARTFGPHLVITDIEMPQMSGWDLFVELHRRRETALTPVIFVTGLGARHDRMRGLRLGAVDYVVKPIDLEELSLRVTNALDYGEGMRQSLQRALAGGVAGSLVHLPLGSLLQVLSLERRSGVLDVRVPDLNARVLLRNGDVVAARPRDGDEPSGSECIYALLRAHDGRFLFTEARVDVRREIEKDTMLLLLEGARRVDDEIRHGTATEVSRPAQAPPASVPPSARPTSRPGARAG
jgi:CheY-like chemotaxis protein